MNPQRLLVGLGIAVIVAAGLGSSIDALELQDGAALVGTWKVDLRPTPDADAYYQEFVVDSVEGLSFTGTFYGSAIEEGRLNADWGAVHFAFVTRDGSGPYNHSGVLRAGRLEGLSHSLGRDFLSVWSAVKQR